MLSPHLQYFILYWGLLLLVIGTWMRYGNGETHFSKNKTNAIILLIFMILIIGVREWDSPSFGDSKAYGIYIDIADTPDAVWYEKSKFFGYLYYYLHLLRISPEVFFIISATYYCAPMYFVSKKFSEPYSAYIFLLFFACSFGWYSFGVNGIRNGWAFATMTWAILAYYDRKIIIAAALLIFAWAIHGSSMIPIGGMLLAYRYRNPNAAFLIWIACVFLSFILGRVVQEYFATYDFIADDGGGYLLGDMTNNEVAFSHTGFRWDFLLFSLAPILWGLYFIRKYPNRNYTTTFYNWILCSYIYANAVWVLAIRANYSNRLAATSWWMMPIIMAYPIYKMDMISNRCKIAAVSLVCYYSFTFFMYLR